MEGGSSFENADQHPSRTAGNVVDEFKIEAHDFQLTHPSRTTHLMKQSFLLSLSTWLNKCVAGEVTSSTFKPLPDQVRTLTKKKNHNYGSWRESKTVSVKKTEGAVVRRRHVDLREEITTTFEHLRTHTATGNESMLQKTATTKV